MRIFGNKPHTVKDEGQLAVIESHDNRYDHKSLVRETTWSSKGMPELSFEEQDYYCKKDPRIVLATDTFKQMLLGNGLKVKCKDEELQKMVTDWIDDINLEEKIEDATDSYINLGNIIFEKYPKMADVVEVDLTTISEVHRDEKARISKYLQDTGTHISELSPKDLIHIKLTNSRREIWGRSMYHALLTDRSLANGLKADSPLLSMWKIERAMPMIFESYASPIMMIHFKDAGKEFIDNKKEEFKKIKPGAKILTDKEFDVKIFEVESASKFTDYVKHFEENIMEVGTQFPLQMFNAGFTARASSETTDSVVLRKIKRMQKRFTNQIKREIVDEYIRVLGRDPRKEDITVYFDTEFKSELTVQDIKDLFRSNVLKRSEIRKTLAKSTNMEIDLEDMEDQPPITSVTPTNNMGSQKTENDGGKSVEESLEDFNREINDLKKLVQEKVPNPRGRPRKTTLV